MKSFLVAVLLLAVIQVKAGPSTSGGGGAFVCRDSKGQVTSSELLDLWEAKNLLNWKVEYSKDPVDTQIQKALSRLKLIDTYIADVVEKELIKIRAEAFYLPSTIALNAPVDANHLYTKPGCPLEGMLYYDGDRMPNAGLVVDNTIFKKLLTPTDVAASWIHEAYYKVYRDVLYPGTMPFGPQKTSISSRRMTGCLFSTGLPCIADLSAEFAPIAGTPIFECDSPDVKLEAYQLGDALFSQWVLVISQIGKRVFSKPVYASSNYLLSNGSYLFSRDFVGGLSPSKSATGDFIYGSFDAAFLRVLPGPTPKINIMIKGWYSQVGESFYTDDYATAINMKCRVK